MKKLMLLAAGLVASVALGACSTTQQAQVNDQLATAGAALNTVGTVVVDGCKVVQPVLGVIGTTTPAAAAAAVANGVFCAANTAVVAVTASTPSAASTPLAGEPLK